MKHKKIETPCEMLSHIMNYICEGISEGKVCLVDTLPDSTEFERGTYYGAIQALDELHQYLRNLDKYGYEHITVESFD